MIPTTRSENESEPEAVRFRFCIPSHFFPDEVPESLVALRAELDDAEPRFRISAAESLTRDLDRDSGPDLKRYLLEVREATAVAVCGILEIDGSAVKVMRQVVRNT